MTASEPRRPRAFRLDPAGPARDPDPTTRPGVAVELQEDAFAREAALVEAGLAPDEAVVEVAQAQGMRRSRARAGWAALFWSSLGGLVSLSVGLWLTRLVEDLFAREAALGWVGVALVALLAAAAVGLGLREVAGILRQSRVARLHQELAAARLADDREAARRLVAQVAALYAARPEAALARAEIAAAAREIVDGRDLVDIAEAALMRRIDRAAAGEIAAAAKRVSVVTAISPRAVLDVLFVGAQIVWLVRRIAELYSGRPGLLGFLRLARSVGAHLAVTSGMAIGDGLIQQVVGHGIAAKLSARLGEGVLNGMLTTRVGLSAMAVCRPMPFEAEPAPSVKDVAPFLFKGEA